MSQYMYRVALVTFKFDEGFVLADHMQPKQTCPIAGVMVTPNGVKFCAALSSVVVRPLDVGRALKCDADYAISAAYSLMDQLTAQPAAPYGAELDADELTRAIRQYRISHLEARRHGRTYDCSKSIFQLVRGSMDDEAYHNLFILVNRVDTGTFAVYRGTFEELKRVFEGTQSELVARAKRASEKVAADADYVGRYTDKWWELRQANITDMLPEKARQDGVLLMDADQLAKWQQQAKYLVCPSPDQVVAALNKAK